MVVAAPASVMMVALASMVASAAAMDGSGKVTAKSAAVCEELASASLAEAVVAVAMAGDVTTVGAMAAVVAVVAIAASTATFFSGTVCAAVVAVLSWEAIAVAPLVSDRRRWVLGFVRAKVWESKGQETRMVEGGRRSFAVAIYRCCAKIRAT